MNRFRVPHTALACALLLTGCGKADKAGSDAADKPQAVLPGSVSDAMIDLDRSQAQAPLGGSGKAAPSGAQAAAERALLGPKAGEADDGADTGDQKPAPAATPGADQPAPRPSASPSAAATTAPRPAPTATPSKAAAAKPAAAPKPPRARATAFPKPGDEN